MISTSLCSVTFDVHLGPMAKQRFHDVGLASLHCQVQSSVVVLFLRRQKQDYSVVNGKLTRLNIRLLLTLVTASTFSPLCRSVLMTDTWPFMAAV